MKDETNKEKPLLDQTIEGIGAMYRSLQYLHEEEYPRNPLMFAIMAQGTVHQLRDLLDDMEWLMGEMTPTHLREQGASIEKVELPAQVIVQKAA